MNGSYDDDETELGKLMHDFKQHNPDKMYHKLLGNKAKYLKEDEKGVAKMSESMSTLVAELVDEEKKESAIRMLNGGKLSIEDIAEYLGLTIKQVEEVAEQIKK